VRRLERCLYLESTLDSLSPLLNVADFEPCLSVAGCPTELGQEGGRRDCRNRRLYQGSMSAFSFRKRARCGFAAKTKRPECVTSGETIFEPNIDFLTVL
jgi:hypothetical protein